MMNTNTTEHSVYIHLTLRRNLISYPSDDHFSTKLLCIIL